MLEAWAGPFGASDGAVVTNRVYRPARHFSRLLRASVLALALVLFATAPAAAAPQLLGAQSHATWSSVSQADMRRELDMLAHAGGKVVRTDISWSSLETEGKGRFSPWYVERIDSFLAHAEARGLKVIGTLGSTPCWASSAPDDAKQGCTGAWWDREVSQYAPNDPADYADAAAWVARRWGHRLAALEIWNEPNAPAHRFLISPDNGLAYTGMLRAAYPRVKDAAPGLPVLGGAMAFSDEAWVERLYALGAGDSFDGLSLHPYNEWRDPDDPWKPEFRKYTFLTGVPAMHEVLRRHGQGHKALWLTELGFSSCGNGDRWCVSEQQQAEYVADSLRIVRGWGFVAAAVVYNLRNKGSNPTDREHQFGLLRQDFTPKPAYGAFAAALAGGPAPKALQAPPAAPAPRRRPRVGRVRIVGQKLVSARRAPKLRVRLRCRRADCVGQLRVTVRSGRRVARASAAGRMARRFAIPSGATRVVEVRLPRRSARLLRRTRRIRVVAQARLNTATAAAARRSFVVRRRSAS